jgi:hypothetical protein
MPSSNFVVSGLTAYIEQNKDLLLKNFGLVGTATRKRIGIQTGVKYKEHLHYLELAPTLQSGAECGFSAAGTATLTERPIECADIKVNMDICPKHLVGKYAEYLVRINATENDLPFEQYIVDGIIAEINKKIEKLIWQGDKSQTSDADIKWIDGFLEQFKDENSALAAYMVGGSALAHGTSAWNAIKAVYMAMPEETLSRGGVIFVSPSVYRDFVMDLVAKNLFHYSGPQDAAPEEIIFPGTDVKVVKTPGLAGTTLPTLIGTFADNLVYGCDMENDNEDIKVWFSDDDDLWKVKVNWNTGVAYHFPNQVVMATIAAS